MPQNGLFSEETLPTHDQRRARIAVFNSIHVNRRPKLVMLNVVHRGKIAVFNVVHRNKVALLNVVHRDKVALFNVVR